MPWFAEVIGQHTSGDMPEVSVVVYDDTTKFVQSYRAHTRDELRRQVLASIAALEQRKGQPEDEFPIGLTIDTAPIVPVPPPDPTAEDIARTDFLVAWRRYQALTRGVDAGLIDPSNKDYLAAEARIQAIFRVEYGELL